MGENFKIGSYKIESKDLYTVLKEAGVTENSALKSIDKNNDGKLTENELQTFVEDTDENNSAKSNSSSSSSSSSSSTASTMSIEEVEEKYQKQIQAIEQQIKTLESQRSEAMHGYSSAEDASGIEQITSSVSSITNQISNLRRQIMTLLTTMESEIAQIKAQQEAAARAAAQGLNTVNTSSVSSSGATNVNTNYGNFSYNFTEKLSSRQQSELPQFKSHWAQNKSRYQTVAARTGVPAELIAAIHWREASGNFNRRLHDGGSLSGYSSWEASAIDALSGGYGNIDLNNINTWYDFAERYNGLGYRNKGVASPYVWAGTTNYTSGKYVADGVYDAGYVDQQLGVAVMLKAIL